MVKLLFFCFCVTNSRLKNKKIHFELLTWWVRFYIPTFGLLSQRFESISQNDPKRAERKECKWQPVTTIHDQLFFTMSTIVLTIPLLTALFLGAFGRWVSVFKYLQEFKVVYQQRQLERLIFDYKPIIVGSWNPRFEILQFKCLWNHYRCSDVAPKQTYEMKYVGDHTHATPSFEHAWPTPRHTVIGSS